VEKEKKIHNKPSKLGTYLGKKAGVDANFEQETDDFLQDSDENLLDSSQNNETDLENQIQEEALLSRSAPADQKVETPKKRNSLLKRLSVLFMVLTVIGVVYAGLYILTPIIIIVPAAICYLIWFVIVAVVSIVTIGIIWVNDGWKNFSQGFLDFNNSLWNFANNTTEVMANLFKGLITSFGLCIVASIVISLVGVTSKRFSHEKYKATLITSIILGVVFVGFTILDIYYIQSGKSVI